MELLTECVSGGIAACGATLVSNPMEVVKTRMQLQGELQVLSEVYEKIMVQEFNVVRCYSCEAFQVEQVKKSTNKWKCKLCNEKQSLKQIFFCGTGKDCRLTCQDLNMKRREKDEETHASFQESFEEDLDIGLEDVEYTSALQPVMSTNEQPANTNKWECFLDEKEEDEENQEDESGSVIVRFRGETTTSNKRKRKDKMKNIENFAPMAHSLLSSADDDVSSNSRNEVHHATKKKRNTDFSNPEPGTRTRFQPETNTDYEENFIDQGDVLFPYKDNNKSDYEKPSTVAYSARVYDKLKDTKDSRRPTINVPASKWTKFLSIEDGELSEPEDI